MPAPANPVATQLPFLLCRLPLEPRSVGRAREALRRRLRAWGIGRDAAGVAELLVSELVTNAVKARAPAMSVVGVRCGVAGGGRLRLEVQDGSEERPVIKELAEEDAECGRGLMLVDALADGWGVDRHVIGKTVWAEMAVPRAEMPGPSLRAL
ncbi:ATP-binding protein [Streptomyces sp. NPDC059080]|uniref:ATP-binding protein n=1 Tax=Streptomyces sp. NPDC059080 TaxID=3346718 RepID=UPI0036A1A687